MEGGSQVNAWRKALWAKGCVWKAAVGKSLLLLKNTKADRVAGRSERRTEVSNKVTEVTAIQPGYFPKVIGSHRHSFSQGVTGAMLSIFRLCL